MTVFNLIRPDILNIPSYTLSEEQTLYRLHANELPWAPVSFRGINLNHYPDIELEKKLKEKLAQRYRIRCDELTITRGGDDAIDYLTRIFLNAGQDALMQFSPTFSMYSYYVRLQQGKLIECPLDAKSNFSISFEQIKEYWQPNCKIIMFCNPNNPTGNTFDLDLIAQVCKEFENQSMVVVDEAYIEFAQDKSAICLLPQFENLILLRTLSKAHGLAGLRLGSIIAQKQVIEVINRIIAPYIHSSPSLALALKAVDQDDWVDNAIERLIASRACVMERLIRLPCIKKVYPSKTNFILIQSKLSSEIAIYLEEKSIQVRSFSSNSILHNHLRITVGNEEQNKYLVEALTQFNQMQQDKL